MSSKDASLHKRKASSPEASSSSSSKYDSKKARKEDSKDKSLGQQQQHADDCEDEDCEIVLQFETTPSAVELFQMAREEASKGTATEIGSTSRLSRMAKALYDKAIEEFEAFDKSHAHIEMNDGTEIAANVLETKIQHAACVVAVGNAMPSSEMLQEGTRMFEELAKTTEKKNGSVLVGLGIAEISQARDLRKKAMKAMDTQAEDDDAEPSEEQREAAALVGKVEFKLATQATENFNKGLELLKATPESDFAQQSIRVAQELEEYGVILDMRANRDLVAKILDQAIQHLEAAQSVKPDLIKSNPDALTIFGSCLHSKARLVDNQDPGDQNPAYALVEKAIELLTMANDMQDEEANAKTLEALGQAYLMSTGLLEDEDMVMNRFDLATETLIRALDLDPDNDVLREQVAALQEGDGYEDEYEGEDLEDEDDDEEAE
ncbi:hypothetical protein BG011_002700 [Mortierella polycephala]|uniref:Uncharacterized protein n=1 Tax=Mortierella polycephala TaxID=41804 RepID=A0A9P6QDL7_9FUNG|nr:hypothetical protein BG011_002700 [Mortierella polycephala]